jgi:hypothetical protein
MDEELDGNQTEGTLDTATAQPADGGETGADPNAEMRNVALVKKILSRIGDDKRHHSEAFKRMRRDMFIAMHGRESTWAEGNYTANLSGRHVKQKTAALYAKNPKAIARRRETLDFAVWDENPDSLMMAFQTMQMAQQMMQAAPIDPMTGQPAVDPMMMPPGFMEAQELIADFQQGYGRQQEIKKLGKTLEILFSHALREQKPLDFKTAMKQVVRRACTTGVGYVELNFQREMGPRPGVFEQLADARQRLEHLRRLTKEAAEGEILDTDAEAAELLASIEALQGEELMVMREGLVFDYPESTAVIPDKMTKSLVGFVGARHLTIRYFFTLAQVQEMFPDADIEEGGFTPHDLDAAKADEKENADKIIETGGQASAMSETTDKKSGLVCVYKHYDKASGLVYFVADGHKHFLRPPAAPDVFVEDFWPVYALTFNAVESEKDLFPLSDVALLLPMQNEYNRARQGKREHRQAARPRWAYSKGGLNEEDIAKLSTANPFDVVGLNLPPGQSLADILQPIPVPGVDPNLYETGQLFTDVQFVVGSSEAQFGGLAKATATESAIAAGATKTSDEASVDDLDAFLTMIARASGQILLKEMSEEKVREIVGVGAVWPQMTMPEIMAELYLEVEAGSSGRPNQAVEVANWQRLLPMAMQMPGINPTWIARETIKRLDDKADLVEAIAAGIPSIAMMNQTPQVAPGPNNPNAQGPEGANNAPATADGAVAGSDPAFGSNQTEPTPTANMNM